MQVVPQQDAPGAQRALPQRQTPSTHISSLVQAGSQLAAWHIPPTQDWPDGQALPQRPQAMLSLRMSAQRPSQQTSVPVQAAPSPQRQVPETQRLPRTLQGMLQPPQSVSEFCVLTHAPSQHSRMAPHGIPALHAVRHTPSRQIVPVGQVMGQPPASWIGGTYASKREPPSKGGAIVASRLGPPPLAQPAKSATRKMTGRKRRRIAPERSEAGAPGSNPGRDRPL